MNVGDKVIVDGVQGTMHAINSDGTIVVEFVGSPLKHFTPDRVRPVESVRQEPNVQQPKPKRVR